jgi:hypothetical protein
MAVHLLKIKLPCEVALLLMVTLEYTTTSYCLGLIPTLATEESVQVVVHLHQYFILSPISFYLLLINLFLNYLLPNKTKRS